MSVRMRHTKGQTGSRRSHHALSEVKAVKDAQSGMLRLPHRIDETTGMYRGKQISVPKERRAHEPKAKGPSSPELPQKHVHEHAREEHANAAAKSSKGVLGKIAGAARPKARSGMGGGV